jgi:hypothetical protein
MNIDSNAVEKLLNDYEEELDKLAHPTHPLARYEQAAKRIAAGQQDAVVEIRKRFRALVSEAIQTPEQAVEAILGSPAPEPTPMPSEGQMKQRAEDIESIERCRESYEGY